jgi:hypothetical protein
MRDDWTRGDLLVAGGSVVAIAAVADLAWTINDRFSADLAELSAFERASVALWDLRPLAAALFALGAFIVLGGLAEPPGRLARAREPVQAGVAGLAAPLIALGFVVVGLAAWVAAAGEIGGAEELGFVYSARDRFVTLATQAAAWLPLAALLAVLARSTLRVRSDAPAAQAGQPAPVEPRRLSEEMNELWRERLAFSTRREQARTLLGRIQALENAGDDAEARRLADEMRRL